MSKYGLIFAVFGIILYQVYGTQYFESGVESIIAAAVVGGVSGTIGELIGYSLRR